MAEEHPTPLFRNPGAQQRIDAFFCAALTGLLASGANLSAAEAAVRAWQVAEQAEKRRPG